MEPNRIGIADDHKLFSNALGNLVMKLTGYEVAFVCYSGKEVLEKMRTAAEKPDIIIMDINMHPIDGIECTKEISRKYPSVKVIALSMYEDEQSMLAMLRAGARGYLLKNISQEELQIAFQTVIDTGYYYSNLTPEALTRNTSNDKLQQQRKNISLSSREKEFIDLCCSDLTYKEIAAAMFVSERTVDGYRENLFKKLHVKSRVGIAIEALKMGFGWK